jgi:hypothetical protein
MRNFLFVGLLLLSPFAAQAQELPEDLASVPGNAIGFAHFRLEDLSKTAYFKMYADLLAKAGPELNAILNSRIAPPLSTIDRATMIVVPPGAQARDPEIALILHFNKPIDISAVTAGLAKQVTPQKATYYVLPAKGVLQVLGKQTLLFGGPGVPETIAVAPKVSDDFKQGLALAAQGKKAIVAAMNASVIPPGAMQNAPPPAQPFLKAKTALATLSLGQEVVLTLDLGFPTDDDAKDAEKTLAHLRMMGKQFLLQAKAELEKKINNAPAVIPIWDFDRAGENVIGPVFGLALVKRGEEILAGIPVKRTNERLQVQLPIPDELKDQGASIPILIGLLVPAVQKVRESATRLQNANNLKQLALAMHDYHDNYKRLPSPAICDKEGKPLLSWRVAILPFIEQEALYREFKLDEPWDSQHNKALIPRMPKIFQDVGANESGFETRYRVIVGKTPTASALFGSMNDKVSLGRIPDGTTNTLMIVEAEESVPWTQPRELTYDPKQLPRLYRNPSRRGFMSALVDGSVISLKSTIADRDLNALITRDGGEALDYDRFAD